MASTNHFQRAKAFSNDCKDAIKKGYNRKGAVYHAAKMHITSVCTDLDDNTRRQLANGAVEAYDKEYNDKVRQKLTKEISDWFGHVEAMKYLNDNMSKYTKKRENHHPDETQLKEAPRGTTHHQSNNPPPKTSRRPHDLKDSHRPHDSKDSHRHKTQRLMPAPQHIKPNKDLYAVLEIPRSASADDIKNAHRKLSLKHHPDRVGDADKTKATAKMAEINQAYDVLSDKIKRTAYDRYGRF
jgi:DnaJ-domain-containing protein 1